VKRKDTKRKTGQYRIVSKEKEKGMYAWEGRRGVNGAPKLVFRAVTLSHPGAHAVDSHLLSELSISLSTSQTPWMPVSSSPFAVAVGTMAPSFFQLAADESKWHGGGVLAHGKNPLDMDDRPFFRDGYRWTPATKEGLVTTCGG
jgi:hypothetical protein